MFYNRCLTLTNFHTLISLQIVSWHFTTTSAEKLFLQTWRQLSPKTFQLIGQVVLAPKQGENLVDLNPPDHIPVQIGDILGFSTLYGENHIPFYSTNIDNCGTNMYHITSGIAGLVNIALNY